MDNISVEIVERRYDCGAYKEEYFRPEIWRENHIIDENLTIKENRRLIEEHNNEQRKLAEEIKKKNTQINIAFREDLIQAVKYDTEFYLYGNATINEEIAEKIFNKIYSNYHSCMTDFFIYLKEECEYIAKIINADRKYNKEN